MPEFGFSLTRVLPYKDKTVHSAVIWENTGQRNPYSHIFYAFNIVDKQRRIYNLMKHLRWSALRK